MMVIDFVQSCWQHPTMTFYNTHGGLKYWHAIWDQYLLFTFNFLQPNVPLETA